MDIRELRSFVLLAGQLNFGKASRLLNLSQPALTKQIRRMEEDLGGRLFVRGKQGTALSPLGTQFLREAKTTLQSFDELVDRGQRLATGEAGQLNLGFGFHTFELVPRLIVKLREMAPEIDVSLKDMSTAEQLAALASGKLDLGFVRLPVSKDLKTLPAVTDRLALVSSSLSSLPANLKLADCRNEPFVAISEERSPGFRTHMLQLCAKHGFQPRVIQQVPEFMTAIALVRAGLGVAIIPESFWSARFEGMRLHRLKDKEAAWSVSAAWNAGDTNPALLRFLTLLREDLKRQK
ncbi:LysR family transcriptional regulator [Luteolibacter yonseiensis]|uniref:LysR family transcriptional regulator n=1 Tax=Luteolibacter yonseiensis TaxID=1144680 RepID=A0A934R3C9_9BACT|nr:LysR family transcriptional regulator [Luteolibacter yonseiensis]MBK1816134.1 LysR family transcriptional regulator [Luteolibacter yonseiensis]